MRAEIEGLSTTRGEERIAWIAPDLARTRGWRFHGEPIVVICADAMGLGDDLEFPTLELPPSDDTPSNAHAILERPEAIDFLHSHQITHLLVFKGNKRLLDRAQSLGFTVMMGDPTVSQRFENKVQFSAIAEELGLQTPRTRTGQRGLPSYEELADELGPRHVLQSARGHSGQGTWRVETAGEHAIAAEAIAHRGWRATTWIDGITWTLNACVGPEGNTCVGPVYQQLTGIPDCTPHRLGACGNAWGASDGPENLASFAETLGSALHRAGYIGAFGVDAIDTGDTLQLIEVNPRLTSGLAMEAMLTRSQGLRGVADAHIHAHLGHPIAPGRLPMETPGSQLVLYSRAAHVTSLQSSPQSGRYRLEGERCLRIDDCTDPTQTADDESIVWARTAHRPIPAGAEFLRIQSTSPLARTDSNALSDRGAQWLRALQTMCPFSP